MEYGRPASVEGFGSRRRASCSRAGLLLLAALIAWTASVWPVTTLAGTPSSKDSYLDGLKGSWIMQGVFANKTVKYDAVGTRVLGGTWLQIHIVDAEKSPKYRADVFIGYDPEADDFIVHWIDSSGAGGARGVATGHLDGERLVVVAPYTVGSTLRDTFQRDRSGEGWTLLTDSQDKNGGWAPFGHFRLTRPAKQRLGHR